MKYKSYSIHVDMADPFFDNFLTQFYKMDDYYHNTTLYLRIRVPQMFYDEWVILQRIKNFINFSVKKEIV